MLVVEVWCGHSGDEELGAVGVGASVGHGQQARLGVSALEVLIPELAAIDGLTPGTVVLAKVTTLDHKLGNDAVEGGVLVMKGLLCGQAQPLFSSAQRTKVLCCPWSIRLQKKASQQTNKQARTNQQVPQRQVSNTGSGSRCIAMGEHRRNAYIIQLHDNAAHCGTTQTSECACVRERVHACCSTQEQACMRR